MRKTLMDVFIKEGNDFFEDLKNDGPIHLHYEKNIKGKNEEVIKLLDYIIGRFNERYDKNGN